MKRIFTLLTFLLPLAGYAQFTKGDAQRCEALAKQVTIVRDGYGVPHIYGKTDADAVFGLMYTQCEDNFKGIERNYLYQLGRQAEADGESRLYEDLQMQLIADTADAIKDYKASPLWFKKLMNAFADGINYYLYKHPEVKPLVFKHYEPWFPLMFTDGSVAATDYGDITLQESQQFYSQGSQQMGATGKGLKREIIEEVDKREMGSNGFAISPSKSKSGYAMLYINPHVPFYFRSEVQLVSDEGLNVYGAVTWGQFFVYQGFNQHCGWMHTSSYADVADVYAEKVSKQNGKWVYQYNGTQKPVTERQIKLSYLKDGQQVNKQFTGYLTHHGPVLANRDGKWLALKNYNRSYNALLESWLITKANNLAEYRKAMELRANTSNNTVYADDKGNTAFWYGDFMPKRNPKYDWRQPVDGTTSATEWQGTHSIDELVHVYNPASGWIQNCNSTPYTSAGKSSPDKDKYPLYMAPDGQNFRGVTAAKLLSQSGKLSLDDMIGTGYNRYLSAFDVLLPELVSAYNQSTDTLKQNLIEPIQELEKWDKISATNSIATTLAVEWGTLMFKNLPKATSTQAGTYQTDRVDSMLHQTSAHRELEYLAEVVKNLTTRFGTWKVKWGDVNRYQRPADGVFDDNKPSLPAASVASTFGQLPSFVSRTQPNTQKRYGYSGNSFIAAVEFGPKIKAKTIETGGTAFDPDSKHFTDQAQGYLDGKFKDVLFYKDDVLKHAEKTYHPGL
jgi:acyl-homoserine-lactone acylase